MFGCKLKKHIFGSILTQFSCFFQRLGLKMLKKLILTSIWSAQHPKAGINIQQLPHSEIPAVKMCHTNNLSFLLRLTIFGPQTKLSFFKTTISRPELRGADQSPSLSSIKKSAARWDQKFFLFIPHLLSTAPSHSFPPH